MKFIHLSDLHLGKRLREFSLLEDQKFILEQILKITEDEAPNAVIIAGDVYDKAVPSTDAVKLFDDFLVKLSRTGAIVLVISGNHDSAERMAFGSRLMEESGVFISRIYDGTVRKVSLEDEAGIVDVHLLPFIKASNVKGRFPDEIIDCYTDAIGVIIDHMDIAAERRNILVAHQFVTGAERSESEDISVGGADNVDASVFGVFDYVALGHLHRPQNIGTEGKIRYCGTPLKYSFSEADHDKSVTVAELDGSGSLSVRTIPLEPLHEMRKLRGTFASLTEPLTCGAVGQSDYLHVTLTDEDEVPEAMGRLRAIYPNIMQIKYDNARTRYDAEMVLSGEMERLSPMEVFEGFYEMQNNSAMNDTQRELIKGLMEEIWEEV